MNNQDIVAMLEECWQTVAAGPLEPTDEDQEGFQRCKASLSGELSSLLQDAMAMKWPFVPEKWQYKQAVAPEDKTTLKELISRHLPRLLTFLRASILAGEPLWAASVVFLVDRFLYWVDTSRSLLKIAEALHKHYPHTPIAPQVVIRQARVSLNSGKLQKAEYILSSLINNSGATGCWVYHADSDRVLVQAVCVQVRGQVLQKLGMWIEAAELIWASLIGLHALPEPDRKGIGTTLGLLANILVSMNDTDFRAFIARQHMDQRLLKERGHRLLAAAEAAKMAVVYSQYDSLYVLTNVVTLGMCLLAYSFLPGCRATERVAVLTEAKEAFEIGLLTKREGEVVASKQELHTLIKAAYSLTITHKWLGSAWGQVHEASQACQEAMEMLHTFSAVGSAERDGLASEIMAVVLQVKAVLGIGPFVTSDVRSFVPDSYRSMEETPARFSMDRFSEVMGRFQKHHAAVCQAQMEHRDGVDGCLGPSVTVMKTATKTLDTEAATEDLRHLTNDRPLGRRPDRQTDRKHVDQQCSTELSDEEEMNDATGSKGPGFKGMSQMMSTSCSVRDGPASFVGAHVRSKDSDTVTSARRKTETWVDQKCLTEVSDEDDQNISSEGPGSSPVRKREGARHRQRPDASSRGSSALPSSRESISSSLNSKSKKGPNHTGAKPATRGPVTEWVDVEKDLQCETKDSDDEDVKTATGSKGCSFNGAGNTKTSSEALRNGQPSFLDTRAIHKDKDTMSRARLRAEMWVDQQCATEFSDEEMNGETNTARAGFKGTGKVRKSCSSQPDGPTSFIDTRPARKCMDTTTRIRQRVETWVDQQCATEFSDEEASGEINCVGDEFKGMDKARTSSSSHDDTLSLSSSWQKLCLSEMGSPVSSGKGTTRPSASHVKEEWVNLDYPEEVKYKDELSQTGSTFEEVKRAGTSACSLDDSLGSSSSWEKLSFSDMGSLPSSGRGVGSTAKQRADVRVGSQCLTLGSDEEDQREQGSLPVCALKRDCPADELKPHPLQPPSSAPNPGPGSENSLAQYRSEEDRSFLVVELPGGVNCKTAALGTSASKGLALRYDSRVCNVDPKAETADYAVGELSMSTDYVDPTESAAEVDGLRHFAEPRSCGIMGNVEGHDERGFEMLCLDDYRQPSNDNQSHDLCVETCMMCSEVPECSPILTEKDYRALLSGVCHKCLLNRLDIKKTFRLRKHRTAYSALLLKYSKVSDRWMSRETKVYIGDPIGKKGCQRTAFWVQILHQEEILGSYVGKTYQFAKEIRYHLTDVERQMTAQHYVTEFNKRLYEKSIPAQIFFIPSEVLLILEGDVIMDCVTVEPYMLGEFVKLTNNTVYTNKDYEATDYGIAFGHFTYQLSGGTEVVVDLQGWVTDSGKGLTYLTDPQIHSVREGGSRARHGEKGIRHFLESQHGPQCNDICHALSLGPLQ